MLIQLHSNIESGQTIEIKKSANGKDVSLLGAFAFGTVVLFSLRVPRKLGVATPVMRLAPDGDKERDLPLDFVSTEGDADIYRLELDTSALCQDKGYGLFYYEFLFVRGWDTFFSDSINNVDMLLSEHSANRFRLLVYEKEYDTPAWFRGGTMYHIFLDRFFRGEGEVALHKDARINPDWHHGIPQYAKRAGDPLSNNVFFGGNLWGVEQKLDYLASLGVTILYLSPVFEAYSNHRYDTGDYEKIDALLGGDAAFDALIQSAHARGMRVVLDGVFNHTGDDSRYFNRRGTYEELGAYQSPKSPYAKWFSFHSFPDSYECWWNIEIMPRLQHSAKSCRDYFTGEGGIVQKWLLRGADGWRLDVADELPDEFLDALRKTVKQTTNGEGIVIGEVWENAADKIAYGKRRRYLSGKQLDSVMNYPFRNAVLALLTYEDTETFYNILTELYASYPLSVCNALMNLLGTHDTERILTKLGDEGESEQCTCNDEFAHLRLTPEQRARAIEKLKLASVLQFTVFGVPSVYYGDEAGVEGYHDPFCRMPFPWGEEDAQLQAHYRALGKLRMDNAVLKDGGFRFVAHDRTLIAYERFSEDEKLQIIANIGPARTYVLSGKWRDALCGDPVENKLTLPTLGWRILKTEL